MHRVSRVLLFSSLLALGLALGGCGQAKEVEDSVSGAPADSTRSNSGPLEPRMPFPRVDVVSLDGQATDTSVLLQGRYSIVIFVQIGCESCTEVMEVWKHYADEFPPEMNVFALVEEEPSYAREYVEESGFPFPLFCDEDGVFKNDYRMNAYPSMVGVGNDGTIAYVGKPVTVEFTPKKAWGLLVQVVEARLKEDR